MFNDPRTADFTFIAEGREVHVHRAVVTEASPFLKQFLLKDPACTRIHANNALYEAMYAVLKYLYATLKSDAVVQVLSPESPFEVVLSAWEIAAHFQLFQATDAHTLRERLSLIRCG